MHSHNRTNRNSLVYWLEFKNDEEFPFIFGSISGGSALKFGVYQNAKTGAWMSRDPSNYPVEISLDQAIEIARRHRDQLLRGVALLEKHPLNGSDADYQTLQQGMDEQAPDVSGVAWGHKYFSLLFPDKLDDYHSAYYQRFHLVKLLQPNIPEERAGRYIAAGRFVAAARELEMPMNHLTTVLNVYNGRPYHYWSILASDARNPDTLNWKLQHEGSFAALTWGELGDLSELSHDSQSKKNLRQMMDPVYPAATAAERQGVFDFVTDIAVDDLIVAFEPRGRKVVGIGKVTGDYYFEPSSAPHRRPVEWFSTDEWQFPDEEGFDTAAKEIRQYANQVEIERRRLDAPQAEAAVQKNPVTPQSQSVPVRLTGIRGRVQIILERKGQVILYGPPGTGKTYWAEATACELAARQVYGTGFSDLQNDQRQRIFGKSDSYVQLCSFHPAYGYEDFLEGFRPQLINDQMSFVRQNGIFKQLCELARKDTEHNYYLIIDEINRGDIPRIFGELLTILEKDKRGKSVLLPLSGEGFAVPSNVFVIGTMNTADRSIALLDTALRRRFGFVELLPDPTQLGTVIIEGIPLGAWLEELNKRILQYVGRDARNLQIGHAYLLENGKPITDFARFARVIREDIIPLLEEYCYEDYSALRQILGATLVDELNQIVHHDLFEPGRENDLIQAILEPTPDLTTLASVTEAESEEPGDEDDDLNNEGQA
jgi:5-methylcytosine-specific restriction protein B